MTPQCKDCCYYSELQDAKQPCGVCCFNPPTVLTHGDSARALTHPTAFCSHWEAKAQAQVPLLTAEEPSVPESTLRRIFGDLLPPAHSPITESDLIRVRAALEQDPRLFTKACHHYGDDDSYTVWRIDFDDLVTIPENTRSPELKGEVMPRLALYSIVTATTEPATNDTLREDPPHAPNS